MFTKKLKSVLLIVLSLFLLFIQVLPVHALPVITDSDTRLNIKIESNEIENWPQGPVVTSQSAILIDADTGTILYEKNCHEKLYPASTTKIMTCLLAMENAELTDTVVFSHDAVFDTPRDSSNIAMDVGYELTMEQCLQAILIASANEASFAVAEHITGTSDWSVFAEMMNKRAKELGCTETNFVNPNGLPDENHYTSAHDLAMIGSAFFANELLCEISSMSRLDLEPTDKQPKHVLENSKNQLLPGKPYAYEYLVGSKTGYTSAAKSTLVSCAEKDGMKLIAVVMVADSPNQFADTVALFQYGFNNFKRINISENESRFNMENGNSFYTNNDIFGDSKPILELNKTDSVILPGTITFDDLSSEISYQDIADGQAVKIIYTYHDIVLGTGSVDFTKSTDKEYEFESVSPEEVKKSGPRVIFINVFKVILWVIGIAGIIILCIMLYAVIHNYHFELSNKSTRANWRRNRKKKADRYRKTRIAAAKRNIRKQKKLQKENRRRRWDDDE